MHNRDFIAMRSGQHFRLDSSGRPILGQTYHPADIAIGLATKCRFNGQLGCFYSVAQHSYIMSRICDQEFAREALLHDAEEVYWCDAPKPWKLMFPELDRPGQAIQAELWNHFELAPMPESLHRLDECMAHTEAHFLGVNADWVIGAKVVHEAEPFLKRVWQWQEAEHWWLQRFAELFEGYPGLSGE